MTDRGAIEILKYERGMFPPYFDGDTEVFDAAISALQEREERSKGCRYCSCGADMKNDEDMEMDLFNYAEGMDFSVYPNFCPMCGRPLKGDET